MPRDNRFPVSFAFRLTEDVASRLRAVAYAHGYRPAEWARKIVSEIIAVDFNRRAVRLRVQNAELLRKCLEELMRQGNNINQIARQLNTPGSYQSGDLLSELEIIRIEQQTLVRAILDALGASETP